jgi:Sulfatase
MSMRPKTVSPSQFALLALTTLAATFDARGEDDFKGIIGRTAKESRPAPPQVVRPKSGSPNVVYILLDDVGLADLRCYGSEIETPNIDRLAQSGLRYNNFHTRSICSPTRAALLTGRNSTRRTRRAGCPRAYLNKGVVAVVTVSSGPAPMYPALARGSCPKVGRLSSRRLGVVPRDVRLSPHATSVRPGS